MSYFRASVRRGLISREATTPTLCRSGYFTPLLRAMHPRHAYVCGLVMVIGRVLFLFFSVLTHVRAAGINGEPAVKRFCEDAGMGRNVSFVFEIGAHDGSWGNHVMTKCRQMAPNSRIRLVLFEPQLFFQARLQQLADKWGGVYYPAVAWSSNTNLTFFLSNFKEASSLSEIMALTFSDPEVRPVTRRTTVPAVDLASVMTRMISSVNLGVVFLKLDTEASEYVLLPRLITSGVLCLTRYVLIEWHLNAVEPERRLAGVLLRNHLEALLQRGCHTPPRILLHDDDPLNNFGESVPGLSQIAQRYDDALRMHGKRPFGLAASLANGTPQPTTHISTFLHRTSNGVCQRVGDSATLKPGCAGGRVGSWRITTSEDRSWTALTRACNQKCQACKKCRFLSVNIRTYECYWWAECDLKRLTPHRGVVTGSVEWMKPTVPV